MPSSNARVSLHLDDDSSYISRNQHIREQKDPDTSRQVSTHALLDDNTTTLSTDARSTHQSDPRAG